MKFNDRFFFVLSSTVFLLLAIGGLSKSAGQGIGPGPRPSDPEYKLGDLRFQYMKRYQPKILNGQNEHTVFLSDQKHNDWLFVSVLKDVAELQQVKESLRALLAENLLQGASESPIQGASESPKCKQGPDPPGFFGIYEKEGEKWQALSGDRRLFVEIHYQKANNQDFLVGYAFVDERLTVQAAEDAFNRGLDAVYQPAGEGCSVIVASITGSRLIFIGFQPSAAPPKPKN